jgi:hypothetical protein
MNPRHRRLLIPGLLIALLAIVLLSSLMGKADGAEATPDVVSTISDPAITESSGLVVSAEDDDLVYTINDSGSAPIVYAIEISSGDTVGRTRLDAPLVDTEALSADQEGALWVADTGDNRAVRTDVALYSTPAPGRTSRDATPSRFPISYPGGAIDVEALAINPVTDQKFLISKGLFGGTVFALPDPLVEGQDNRVAALEGDIPGIITDAAFTPDGRYVVARDYSEAYVLDASTWQILSSQELPEAKQGETLAVETGGRSFLVGSEGAGSPLIRIAYQAPEPAATPVEPSPSATATSVSSSPAAATGNGFAGSTWFWAAIAVTLLAFIGLAATRRS